MENLTLIPLELTGHNADHTEAPWVPPRLFAALQIGVRVRVRLGGECEAWRESVRSCGCSLQYRGHLYVDRLQGRTGKLVVPPATVKPHHPYCVQFHEPFVDDHPWPCKHVPVGSRERTGVTHGLFSAGELILLDVEWWEWIPGFARSDEVLAFLNEERS